MKLTRDQLRLIGTLFRQYGIRSVTMDDISKSLGISKKTLYEAFPSKEELLNYIIEEWIKIMQDSTCEEMALKQSANAIDEIVTILKHLSTSMHNINPIFFWELEKYYPEQAKKLNEFREKYISEKIRKNLEKGIAEKLYRSDINIDIVVMIYKQLVRSFPQLLQEDNLKDKFGVIIIMKEIYYYHLNAIVNEEGRKYLNEILKTSEI
jgi:AcrR family transcriptional regulator